MSLSAYIRPGLSGSITVWVLPCRCIGGPASIARQTSPLITLIPVTGHSAPVSMTLALIFSAKIAGAKLASGSGFFRLGR